jgi:hypothetical protein
MTRAKSLQVNWRTELLTSARASRHLCLSFLVRVTLRGTKGAERGTQVVDSQAFHRHLPCEALVRTGFQAQM